MPSKIGLGFKIKNSLAKMLSLSEDIQPMLPPQVNESSFANLDLTWLLGHSMSHAHTTGVTGTGNLKIYETIEDCREHIVNIWIYQSSGSFTFNSIYLYDVSKTELMKIADFGATTEKLMPSDENMKDIELEPGDEIWVYINAVTTAGNIVCHVWKKIWLTARERDPWFDV